jgi:hypothetical protein
VEQIIVKSGAKCGRCRERHLGAGRADVDELVDGRGRLGRRAGTIGWCDVQQEHPDGYRNGTSMHGQCGTLACAARTARNRDELSDGLGRLGRRAGTISWRDDRGEAPDRHRTGSSDMCT